VGKGHNRRAFDMRNRNRRHKFLQAKLLRNGFGIEVRIVAKDLSEKDAFEAESARIAFWLNDGARLVNLGTGGSGGHTGARHTEEWKRKCRERMKALLSDPEVRKSLSIKNKGKKRTEESKKNYRGQKSPEHVEAMKLAAKNRKRPIPRTEEHSKKLAAALRDAWSRKSQNPFYAATIKSRRLKKSIGVKNNKQETKERKESEAAALRFNQFINALIDGTEYRCCTCKMTKAPEQFTRTNQGPRGLSYVCKPCKAIDALNRRRHPEMFSRSKE
jgi:hypothetical protein